MKNLILLIAIGLFLFAQTCLGQSWTSFINPHQIYDAEPSGKYVWVCTSAGLQRIDTTNSKAEIFDSSNSIITGGLSRTIAKGTDGSLWVGGYGIYQVIQNQLVQKFVPDDVSLNESVLEIKIDINGIIWIKYSGGKLYSFQNGTFERHDQKIQDLLRDSINFDLTYLSFDSEGHFWHVAEDLIFKYDGKEITQQFRAGDRGTPDFNGGYKILFDDQNRPLVTLLLKGTNGAFNYKQHYILEDDFWRKLEDITVPSSRLVEYKTSKDKQKKVVLVQQNSTFIIGFFQNNTWEYRKTNELDYLPFSKIAPKVIGINDEANLTLSFSSEYYSPEVLIQKPDKWKRIQLKGIPALLDNNMRTIEEDCDGNIWVGEQRHVAKFDSENWTSLFESEIKDPPVHPPTVEEIFTNPLNCDVLFGLSISSTLGSFLVYDGDSLSAIPVPSNIYDIAFDGSNIFSTTFSGEIGVLSNGQWTFQSVPFNTTVIYLDFDSKGNIYASTGGFIHKFENGTWKQVFFEPDGTVRQMLIDHNDVLFAIFNGELLKFENNTWTLITEFEGVASIEQDTDGTYWVGGNNELWHWDGEKIIEHFTIFNSGLIPGTNSKIKITQNGHIWLLNCGVSRFIPENKTVNLSPKNLNWKLYPNPAIDYVNLEFGNEAAEIPSGDLNIYNYSGQRINSFSIRKKMCIELPQGFYLLEWVENENRSVKKLVVVE